MPLIPLSESTTLQREGTEMTKTRRIVAAGFVMVVTLGTAWAYERTQGTHPRYPGAVDAVVAPANPVPPDAPVTDYVQEYDRSDLVLTQG